MLWQAILFDALENTLPRIYHLYDFNLSAQLIVTILIFYNYRFKKELVKTFHNLNIWNCLHRLLPQAFPLACHEAPATPDQAETTSGAVKGRK